MDFKAADDFVRRLRRKPIATAILTSLLVVAAAAIAWVTSCSAELGRRAGVASQSEHESGTSSRSSSNLTYSAPTATATAPTLTIDQITMGIGDGRNRIEVSVSNPEASSVVIRQIAISATISGPSCGSDLGQASFTISDRMAFSARTSQLRGSYQLGADREYRYPVTGSFIGSGCGGANLDLTMRSNTILTARTTAKLYIVVPQFLRISDLVAPSRGTRGRVYQAIAIRPFSRLTVTLNASNGSTAFGTAETGDTEGPPQDNDLNQL